MKVIYGPLASGESITNTTLAMSITNVHNKAHMVLVWFGYMYILDGFGISVFPWLAFDFITNFVGSNSVSFLPKKPAKINVSHAAFCRFEDGPFLFARLAVLPNTAAAPGAEQLETGRGAGVAPAQCHSDLRFHPRLPLEIPGFFCFSR